MRQNVTVLAQYQGKSKAALDVDDFITYMMIVNYYGGNHDWGCSRWYASR